jgi:protoporphyrinogen IX oxidase
MAQALAMTYLWLKAGHIIFVVFWMAGLFMLPRQMIYMLDTLPGSAEEATWARRTGLLRRIILTPSLVVVWVLGFGMSWQLGLFAGAAGLGWLYAKLLFVVLLTGFHGMMVARAKAMARGERPLSERQLRMWGEAPGVLLALIVVLVVIKPF